jgi:capsular exopolysaccharide synthesis family protein
MPRSWLERASGPSPSASSERISFDESLRILRSNLSVALLDLERPTVIFTSPNANEGKTVTCSNLALSFAASGARVVLVDLDFRHPNAHLLIGAHNEFGVTDILLGKRSLEECIQYIALPSQPGQSERGLYFLSTGGPVANPTEILSSGRTHQLLDGLARQADLVLLDTPPVLPVADTLVIGRMAAGAVLVTASRTTAIDAVTKAKDLLTRNQTRLLGVVLNKFQPRDARRATFGYGYGYGYGYGSRPDDQVTPPPVEPADRTRRHASQSRSNWRNKDAGPDRQRVTGRVVRPEQ